MGLNNLPTWLKGGIAGGISILLLSFVWGLLSVLSTFFSGGKFNCGFSPVQSTPCDAAGMMGDALLIGILLFIPLFIIGSIIGFIVGKFGRAKK